ncbi:hypothetical protein BGX27_010776, partial [Mortierella sp. AM989]
MSTADTADSLSISPANVQIDDQVGLIITPQVLDTYSRIDSDQIFKVAELNLDQLETSTPSAPAQSLNKHYDPTAASKNRITLNNTVITPDLLPLIDLTQDDIDSIIRQIDGGAANIQDIYALSSLQDGILFHHIMATKGDPYLTLKCMVFENRDILDRYLEAFQKVTDRHDILRTAIVWENLSSSAQVVLRQVVLSVIEVELNPVDGLVSDQLMKLFDPREHRIDITQAPLIRFATAQDIDGSWVVVQLMHHLIDDHYSLQQIQSEIKTFLEGRGETLPSPEPFRNIIAEARSGPGIEAHEKFFTKMLAEIDTPSLMYGMSDIHHDGVDIAESNRMVPQDLVIRLRGHAKSMGVSLARMCHLAWAQVIACTSGQHNVVFGTVVSGRTRFGTASRAMGPFINTLPFRIDLQEASVEEALLQTQSGLTALLEHQHASLTVAQRCSKIPVGTPLFNAVLNYRRSSAPASTTRSIDGMQVISEQERTNYSFVMSVDDFGTDLCLTCQVRTSVDAMRVCGYMEQALYSLADALDHTPSMPARELEILPIEERDLLLQTWNTTSMPYPDHLCIHQMFESQVVQSPHAIALVYEDRTLTYHELNVRANHLALQLYESGIKHGDFIAILLKRSFELVVTQLAILKVGAAYVPIDPKAPKDRQIFIVHDCAAKLLITDEQMQVPATIQTPLLRVAFNCAEEVNMTSTSHGGNENALYCAHSSLDTAYAMYTSGSTGIPKGVLVPHRAIARLTINNGYTNIGPHDRVAFAANPAFDASTFEVWAPLLNGGRVVIIDADTFTDSHRLGKALDHHQVTTLFLTTVLFNQFVVSIGPVLTKLKYLLCGGEQESLESFSTLLKYGGPEHLIHCYGPTETTTFATTYE